MAPLLLLTMAAGYGGGALLAALFPEGRSGRAVTAAGAMVGAAGGLPVGIDGMAGGEVAVRVPWLLSPGGGVALRLDALAGFFLAVVSLVALPAALYGIGYASGTPHGPARRLGSTLNLFLLTMSLVPLA